MATNLETKNTVERDETKEELAGLKKEVEKSIDKRVYLEVDSAFNKFVKETDAKVRLEKNVRDGKLKLISYGGTCELDLKTNSFSVIKGGKVIDLVELTGTSRNLYTYYSGGGLIARKLLESFRKMNIINKAVHISSEHSNNRKFYFDTGNFFQTRFTKREALFLTVDGVPVSSIGELHDAKFKVEGTDQKREFLNMLNKIVA